jgi:hypothetical protein
VARGEIARCELGVLAGSRLGDLVLDPFARPVQQRACHLVFPRQML